MTESPQRTSTPTRTTPTVLPEPMPGKRLSPREVCPAQVQRIARRGKRELRP